MSYKKNYYGNNNNTTNNRYHGGINNQYNNLDNTNNNNSNSNNNKQRSTQSLITAQFDQALQYFTLSAHPDLYPNNLLNQYNKYSQHQTATQLISNRHWVHNPQSPNVSSPLHQYTYDVDTLTNGIAMYSSPQQKEINGNDNNNNDNNNKIEGNNQAADDFTVMSYNVLSTLHIQLSAYPGTPKTLLNSQFRLAKIMLQLAQLQPSVLCLQEVDVPFATYIPILNALGYQATFKLRRDPLRMASGEGLIIAWQFNKFRCLGQCGIEYSSYPAGPAVTKEQLAMCCLLQQRDVEIAETTCCDEEKQLQQQQGKIICIVNTHILFNPQRINIKTAQAQLMLNGVYSWLKTLQLEGGVISNNDNGNNNKTTDVMNDVEINIQVQDATTGQNIMIKPAELLSRAEDAEEAQKQILLNQNNQNFTNSSNTTKYIPTLPSYDFTQSVIYQNDTTDQQIYVEKLLSQFHYQTTDFQSVFEPIVIDYGDLYPQHKGQTCDRMGQNGQYRPALLYTFTNQIYIFTNNHQNEHDNNTNTQTLPSMPILQLLPDYELEDVSGIYYINHTKSIFDIFTFHNPTIQQNTNKQINTQQQNFISDNDKSSMYHINNDQFNTIVNKMTKKQKITTSHSPSRGRSKSPSKQPLNFSNFDIDDNGEIGDADLVIISDNFNNKNKNNSFNKKQQRQPSSNSRRMSINSRGSNPYTQNPQIPQCLQPDNIIRLESIDFNDYQLLFKVMAIQQHMKSISKSQPTTAAVSKNNNTTSNITKYPFNPTHLAKLIQLTFDNAIGAMTSRESVEIGKPGHAAPEQYLDVGLFNIVAGYCNILQPFGLYGVEADRKKNKNNNNNNNNDNALEKFTQSANNNNKLLYLYLTSPANGMMLQQSYIKQSDNFYRLPQQTTLTHAKKIPLHQQSMIYNLSGFVGTLNYNNINQYLAPGTWLPWRNSCLITKDYIINKKNTNVKLQNRQIDSFYHMAYIFKNFVNLSTPIPIVTSNTIPSLTNQQKQQQQQNTAIILCGDYNANPDSIFVYMICAGSYIDIQRFIEVKHPQFVALELDASAKKMLTDALFHFNSYKSTQHLILQRTKLFMDTLQNDNHTNTQLPTLFAKLNKNEKITIHKMLNNTINSILQDKRGIPQWLLGRSFVRSDNQKNTTLSLQQQYEQYIEKTLIYIILSSFADKSMEMLLSYILHLRHRIYNNSILTILFGDDNNNALESKKQTTKNKGFFAPKTNTNNNNSNTIDLTDDHQEKHTLDIKSNQTLWELYSQLTSNTNNNQNNNIVQQNQSTIITIKPSSSATTTNLPQNKIIISPSQGSTNSTISTTPSTQQQMTRTNSSTSAPFTMQIQAIFKAIYHFMNNKSHISPQYDVMKTLQRLMAPLQQFLTNVIFFRIIVSTFYKYNKSQIHPTIGNSLSNIQLGVQHITPCAIDDAVYDFASLLTPSINNNKKTTLQYKPQRNVEQNHAGIEPRHIIITQQSPNTQQFVNELCYSLYAHVNIVERQIAQDFCGDSDNDNDNNNNTTFAYPILATSSFIASEHSQLWTKQLLNNISQNKKNQPNNQDNTDDVNIIVQTFDHYYSLLSTHNREEKGKDKKSQQQQQQQKNTHLDLMEYTPIYQPALNEYPIPINPFDIPATISTIPTNSGNVKSKKGQPHANNTVTIAKHIISPLGQFEHTYQQHFLPHSYRLTSTQERGKVAVDHLLMSKFNIGTILAHNPLELIILDESNQDNNNLKLSSDKKIIINNGKQKQQQTNNNKTTTITTTNLNISAVLEAIPDHISFHPQYFLPDIHEGSDHISITTQFTWRP